MKKSKLVYWLFLFPCVLTFTMTIIIPVGCGLYYSFTDWNGIGKKANFIGFGNYISIFTHGDEFFKTFMYTLLFTLMAVILVNTIAFALALLVTMEFKGRNILRCIFFMPNLIGGILIGFIWQFIFTQVFNSIGTNFNLKFLQNWLSTEATATAGMVIVVVWQMAGYMMLVYIAQLQNIPTALIEAAEIDGATKFQKLRYITLPLMMPAFTICLFLTLSNCFKLYDLNLALTNGGPSASTEMISLNICKTAFSLNKLGLAQAKAVIFTIIIAAITLTQLYISKKREVEM